MLNSVTELNAQSAVILLYPSGASGEFIAHALTLSIPEIAKTKSFWENNNRIIYLDFLGRSLNSGDSQIDLTLVVNRANLYLQNSTPGLKVILAHPDIASLNFIKEYLPSIPLIEVVIYQPASKIFRKLSAAYKIPRNFVRNPNEYDGFPSASGYTSSKNLYIEWEDIITKQPHEEFKKILNFLKINGSVEIFQTLVDDYIQRNQSYI